MRSGGLQLFGTLAEAVSCVNTTEGGMIEHAEVSPGLTGPRNRRLHDGGDF